MQAAAGLGSGIEAVEDDGLLLEGISGIIRPGGAHVHGAHQQPVLCEGWVWNRRRGKGWAERRKWASPVLQCSVRVQG